MNCTEEEKAVQLPCILDQYIFDTWYSKMDNVEAFTYGELKVKMEKDLKLKSTQVLGARRKSRDMD